MLEVGKEGDRSPTTASKESVLFDDSYMLDTSKHLTLTTVPSFLRKYPDKWKLYTDSGPSFEAGLLRFQHPIIVPGLGDRSFGVELHFFDQPQPETALHCHEGPVAVYPICEDGTLDFEVYKMPWELREGRELPTVLDSGECSVRTGNPYAIEDFHRVFHALNMGTHPFISVVIIDLKDGFYSTKIGRKVDSLTPAEADPLPFVQRGIDALRRTDEAIMKKYF